MERPRIDHLLPAPEEDSVCGRDGGPSCFVRGGEWPPMLSTVYKGDGGWVVTAGGGERPDRGVRSSA